MKNLLLTLAILLSFNCLSQNLTYQIIYDSLRKPLYSDDYNLAKKIWLSLDDKSIDPAERLIFLNQSLKNNDIKYFKKEIKKSILRNGWRYDPSLGGSLTALIIEKGLDHWVKSKYRSLYPRWVKKNLHALIIREKIDKLIIRDQYLRETIPQDLLTDTNSVSEKILNILITEDFRNLHSVIALADSNKILPNHFDHGVGTYYQWTVILLHNLKTKEKFNEAWEIILPYLEATYFAGKIGDDLFRLYDRWSNWHFGNQYYGFLEDVPIIDLEGFENRKQKYKFKFK